MTNKPELLVPAGSLEVLKTAVIYGADAVFIGGEAFGLRNRPAHIQSGELALNDKFGKALPLSIYVRLEL